MGANPAHGSRLGLRQGVASVHTSFGTAKEWRTGPHDQIGAHTFALALHDVEPATFGLHTDEARRAVDAGWRVLKARAGARSRPQEALTPDAPIRLDVHPADFDRAAGVRALESALLRLGAERRAVTYDELAPLESAPHVAAAQPI